MSANSELTMAVHILCWIELASRRGSGPLTSAEIAASLANHPVQVRRTLAPLRRAGLVVAGRGPGAGWKLSRPAETMTLADVKVSLDDEGPFALHAHDPNPECPVGARIRPVLAAVYADVETAIDRELARRTVADVLDEILAAERGPARRRRSRA